MKRNVSVVCVCSAPNCCDTEQWGGKIIKEMPGSIVSETHCRILHLLVLPVLTYHKARNEHKEITYF